MSKRIGGKEVAQMGRDPEMCNSRCAHSRRRAKGGLWKSRRRREGQAPHVKHAAMAVGRRRGGNTQGNKRVGGPVTNRHMTHPTGRMRFVMRGNRSGRGNPLEPRRKV